MIYHCWFDLDHLAEVMYVMFLHSKFTLSPPLPPQCCLEESHYLQPHLRSRELYFTFLRIEYLYKNYLEFFCMGNLSLIYLFIKSFTYNYRFTAIYFILWVIMQYFVVEIVSSLTTGASFSVWHITTILFGFLFVSFFLGKIEIEIVSDF